MSISSVVDSTAAGTAGPRLQNRAHFRRALHATSGSSLWLRALDPAATLARGFSVVENLASGQVVSLTSQVAPGDSLSITVADGVVLATAGTGTQAKPLRKKRKSVTPQQPQQMELLL